MPVILDRGSFGAGFNARPTGGLTIGLVNNMPDQALEATERQFTQLLAEASGPLPVRLRLFALPDVPRSEWGWRWLKGAYADFEALMRARLDGLIISGTEPQADDLRAEPYWDSLCVLTDWAREHTMSTAFSCLAAHAAVLHLDGVERRPLPGKRLGVLSCEQCARHPLASRLPPRFRVPHSRWNELRADDLHNAGYTVLTQTAAGDVDMFAKDVGSLFFFLQGHPEYEATTLMREYRRDIGRWLNREREDFPVLPADYFGQQARADLAAYAARVRNDRRVELLSEFPAADVEATLTNRWRASAVSVYRNWLTAIAARKARPRAGEGPQLHAVHTAPQRNPGLREV